VNMIDWCQGYRDGQDALWSRVRPRIESTIWSMAWEHLCSVLAACAALDRAYDVEWMNAPLSVEETAIAEAAQTGGRGETW
jgi:hypothetical protein